MKKKYCLCALAFLGLTLTACGTTGSIGLDYDDSDLDIDTPWVDYSVPVTKINFKEGEESIEVNKGETHEYDYSLEPTKAKKSSLSWSSNDEHIATVERGVVTGINPGEAEVTVSNEIDSFEPVTLNVKVNSPLKDIAFSSESLAADYDHSYDLEKDLLVYTPYDTTDKGLSWSVDCANSIAEINAETGVLTTKSTASTVIVTATSAIINKTISLTVEIADRTIYPASVIVDEYESEIEISHNFQFSAHAVAADPDVAVTHPEITYHSDDTSILIVEEDTGVVHAVGEGTAHIYARASNGVESTHLEVNVFEVKVLNINLSDITLSNKYGRSDVAVNFTYTTDKAGYDKASIPNFVYSTGDETVATVNDNGKLFAVAEIGDTTLTVKETRSNVSKTVNLHVGYEVDTVSVSAASSTVTVGYSTQLSVSTDPSGVPASFVSYSSSDESVATVSDTGVVTATGQGTVEITATVLGHSGKVTINTELPEIPFDAGYAYVVGNKNYSTGTSQASASGSWDKANQAKRVDDKVQDAHDNLLYERRTIVYFHEKDIWKLRSANGAFGSPYGYLEPNGWPEGATYPLGEYKAEGSLANDDMIINSDNNVEVNREGWYAIYHAQYTNENPLGWYSIYVGRYELYVSDATPAVQVGQSVTIEAHDWAGVLSYEKTEGANLITVTRGEGEEHQHEFTITAGDTAGTALIVFTDEFKSVTVEVSITTEPPVTGPDYYLKGTFNEWSQDENYKFIVNPNDPNNYKLENLTIYGGSEMKGWDTNDVWYDMGGENLIINDDGIYTIDLYVVSDNPNHLVATKTGDIQYDYYLKGTFNDWTQLDDYKFSATGDANHYVIEGVEMSSGDGMQAWGTNNVWYGVGNEGKQNLVVNADGVYTVDLYLDSPYQNYIVATKTGEKPGGDTPVPSTLKTYYFTNSNDYKMSGTIYAYVWNSSDTDHPLAGWPGTQMTWVYTNDYGEDVYSITVDTSLYNYIIFNNNSKQTVDIALSSFGSNNACNASGESGGKYTVSYWNYSA